MKRLLCLLLPLALAATVNAQQGNWSDAISNQKSIQISAGTEGVGAEFQYGLFSKLALRLGGNLLPVTADNVIHVSGFNSTSKVTANFSNIHLLADFTPFKGASALRIVAGAAYFFQANGGMEVQPTDSYNYGDIVVDKNTVGDVNLKADWSGVAPYIGLGLMRIFPSRLFNINVDLGTYYLNQPTAQIIGTGILDGNSSQTAQLQSNIKDYRFLPVLQLNFNFKL